MANSTTVTVDRSYFEALLRRADFHTTEQACGFGNAPANITISRAEYDSLLRISREHQLLKDALYQGGITQDTLGLLTSGPESPSDQRKDSGITLSGSSAWDEDLAKMPYSSMSFPAHKHPSPGDVWRNPTTTFNPTVGSAPYPSTQRSSRPVFRAPMFQRQGSHVESSIPDDVGFDDDGDQQSVDEMQAANQMNVNANNSNEKRTLYFSGLSDRTTYSDLLSVVKGGKIISVSMRERAATVSFLEGAADFLGWAKKNDIYLQSKRIQVSWATRQFNLNPHTATKITSGATRNLCIRGALNKNLTESQIRDDMEHIHNLVIISVIYSNAGDAFVSTNAVHNALFARTCMMSRAAYRGCQIEFHADECDVSLPVGQKRLKDSGGSVRTNGQLGKKNMVANRFGLLNLDDGSDEENRIPSEDGDSEDGIGMARSGINLRFLDEGEDED